VKRVPFRRAPYRTSNTVGNFTARTPREISFLRGWFLGAPGDLAVTLESSARPGVIPLRDLRIRLRSGRTAAVAAWEGSTMGADGTPPDPGRKGSRTLDGCRKRGDVRRTGPVMDRIPDRAFLASFRDAPACGRGTGGVAMLNPRLLSDIPSG
jgi:hypothetical protein